MKCNENVRRAARIERIPLWKICLEIGISEPTMSRWLRTPLPEEKEKRIMKAIEKLSREVTDG